MKDTQLTKRDGIKMTTTARELAEHEHTHSLYVHCLSCQMFGTPMPTRFIDAVECGNCGSMDTVKYYPLCCILAAQQTGRESVLNIIRELDIDDILKISEKLLAKLKEPT